MKTTIYLLRHGEYANPKAIAPYRLPGFYLSAKGVADVEAMARKLADVPISAVFTSPMERTQQTAKILAAPHGLTPEVDDRLLEVRSPLEGKTVAEVESLGGWNWSVYDTAWHGQGDGETLQEIYERVIAVFDEKRAVFAGKHIILVTHGDPVMLVAATCLNIPLRTPALSHMSYVPMGGGYRLVFDGESPVEVTSL